jgi:hypothetical protein
MHRMSLLDSQFLHLEDRTGPLHIAAVCTFEGQAPSRDELRAPGPPVPLYLRGRKLSALLPYVPIYQGLRTGIAVISYDRQITFGVTADLESTI